MGLVFKARQRKLDRSVALKLLPQKPGADPAFCERFRREARVLARLSHPNIVAVHDFGEAGPFFYLLMEYVDGVNLRQAMQSGRFTPAQALALVPKICDALQYAHEEGVLHRDIKPENLLLDMRGRVKIADFGIAKLLGETKDITLTASGSAIGTPHYMAPEQLERPQEVDQRADVYSLGVVFYEMLTGELPIGRFAPPSEKAPIDPRLDRVVLRSLEKERERRYQSAGDVKTQVEKITATPAGGQLGSTGTLNLTNANQGRQQSAEGDDVAATSRPPGSKWSLPALAASFLVGVSLLAFGLVLLSRGRLRVHEVTLLAFIIGFPATAGMLLGWNSLRDLQICTAQKRGGRLALLSVITWPLILLDLFLLMIPLLFAESLEWNVLHARGGFITVLAGVIVTVGIVVADILILRHFLRRWNSQRVLPHAELRAIFGRLPRRVVSFAGSALALLFLVLFISHLRIQRLDEPPALALIQEPSAPSGFEISPGGPPGNDGRLYRSTVLVPPGYALTIATVLCSNQMVLKPGPANSSAVLMAPEGQTVQGQVSWRFLGNTTFADGAPLQFSIGFSGPEGAKSFNLVPPEPVTIDWAAEPPRMWPPQSGRTKFLLVKGSSANSESEPAAEWGVGIEARLDPIPEGVLRDLKRPIVTIGTNAFWPIEQASQTARSQVDNLDTEE
jgi:predicted Ser/Thr protein kinase